MAMEFMINIRDGEFVAFGEGQTYEGDSHATIVGGNNSTIESGYLSNITGGRGSVLVGGDRSFVSGGYGSMVSGGIDSVLTIDYFDGKRDRIAIAYVGEDGIEPNVMYKLDREAKFVKA